MAKVKMKHIELIGQMCDSKKLLDLLQRKGVIDIKNYDENEKLTKISTNTSISQIERMMDSARQAKEIVDKYIPYKKAMTDSFKPRKEIALSEFDKMSNEADKILAKCYNVISLNKTITDSSANIIRCNALQESLKPWLALDLPMRFKGTKSTTALIGTIPKQLSTGDIKNLLSDIEPSVDMYDIEVISSEPSQTCVAAICHNEQFEAFNTALRSIGFMKPSDPTKHPPKVRMERLSEEISKCKQDIHQCEVELKNFNGLQQEIDFLLDFFTLRKEKYDAMNKIAMGKNFFVLTGFIPEPKIESLSKLLDSKFDVAYSFSDVDYENEDVPVLLKNNWFARPVESITEMYSPPNNNDIDPNGVMAFFYYVFFGMMFSDAGYGLLMVGVLLFVLFKFKPEGRTRENVKMYLFCGISTTFWGVMYGGFFGDIINVVRTNFLGKEAINMAVWLDPINDIMTLLLYCLLFGIVHLFVGVALKSIMEWKEGHKADAILDFFPTFLTVAGAAPLCAGMIIEMPEIVKTVGKYSAIIGVISLVLTAGRHSKTFIGKIGGGLYALYNTASGYIGDILSYARLFALGLATGIIAQVVNMVGTIPQSTAMKIILLLIVFPLGHAINIGISLIGTYVHTNRLQYVEFFSRFYEGGGTPFTPLQANTKTFKFKEEN